MFIRVASLCALLLLAACAKTYTPEEFPLPAGAIPAFTAGGPVTISNGQSSGDSFVVYTDAGTKWTSDLRTITQAMVEQATEEVRKDVRSAVAGAPKSLDVKVETLSSEYNIFHWNSEMQFSVTLGNGDTIAFTVQRDSGLTDQDLNGCIAEAVRTMLNDRRVRAYIAG